MPRGGKGRPADGGARSVPGGGWLGRLGGRRYRAVRGVALQRQGGQTLWWAPLPRSPHATSTDLRLAQPSAGGWERAAHGTTRPPPGQAPRAAAMPVACLKKSKRKLSNSGILLNLFLLNIKLSASGKRGFGLTLRRAQWYQYTNVTQPCFFWWYQCTNVTQSRFSENEPDVTKGTLASGGCAGRGCACPSRRHGPRPPAPAQPPMAARGAGAWHGHGPG